MAEAHRRAEPFVLSLLWPADAVRLGARWVRVWQNPGFKYPLSDSLSQSERVGGAALRVTANQRLLNGLNQDDRD